MLIIGGPGYLYGGLIGAAIFVGLRDLIAGATPEYWEFWIGLLLVALVTIGRDRVEAALEAARARGCACAAPGGGAMSAALEARGLFKRFGGLLVTDDVSLTLAPGARHALIGPNGAGKTTLINLLTGVLKPSKGAVLLGGEDVTALPASARVRRGLARTFQINQLFAEFSPAEALAAAIAERDGLGADAVAQRRVARRRSSPRSSRCSTRFGLLADMDRPTRTLAYGKQRLLEIALALACRPRALLLDEPAAGVPEDERRDILAALAALPEDVAILLIEHDMDLVFSFARAHHRAGRRPHPRRGRARRDRRRRAGARRLSRRGRRMAELLRVEGLSAGYGEAIVIEALDLVARGRPLAGVLGPQRRGKTTLINALIGAATSRERPHRASPAPTSPACHRYRRARAGLGWCPQERNIFRSLTVEENLDRGRACRGRGGSRASTACSRACASAAPTWAANFPAASSRCWRSGAR